MRKSWRKNRISKVHSFDFLTIGQRTVLLLFVIVIAAACTRSKNTVADPEVYTCSMHPQIIRDKPGTCPICGMELVRKLMPGEELMASADLNQLTKPTNASVVSSIRTISPIIKTLDVKSEAKGVIAHDTRKVITLSARYGGRIEKLYVRYNQQEIRKGQKIMEVYSPELVTAQRELLYVLENDADNIQIVTLAKQKLSLLGMTDAQLNTLISSKTESNSFAIYSPTDGYIMDHILANTTMEGNSNAASELRIREGKYITSGESLFTVVSHSDLWAEFNIYQRDAPTIKLSDPLNISVDKDAGQSMQLSVSFIQPYIKGGENFMKVRAYLTNQHRHYHAGQLVTATFTTSVNSMWIPMTAIIDLGTQTAVFIKQSGAFMPRAISRGNQTDDLIEVLDGIQSTDSIAYNAQFMVDSESFIHINQNN